MKLPPVIVLAALALLGACQTPPSSTVNEKTEALLKQMTLEEKIGQMTQVDSDALQGREQDIAKYALGSVLSGGNSNPPDSSARSWKSLIARLDSYASQTRLRIPVIYGIDAVHGDNNVTRATIFPHNIGLGATRDPKAVEAAARVTAEEVAGIGADWAFAPCVAVARNERWGRTYESFGENPKLVATMGAAAVRGLQGADLSAPSGILSCTKHFLGDGGTTDGQDQGNTQVDLATLRRIHLPGYIAAIKAGTQSVMVSYSSWNGRKMHAQRDLITGVLKGELHFQGFVVSDWAAIDQIDKTSYRNCVEQSINAGLDMVMIPNGVPNSKPGEPPNKIHHTYREFITDLAKLVHDGKVPMSRIDDAVRRILRVKFELGLFEARKGSPDLFAAIGSAAHREVARDCVRKSLVLLQNRNHVLPLSKQIKRLGVTGRGADDLNMQCGGWTIDWQSTDGMHLLGATTILQAIKASVSPQTQIVHSPDGTGLQGCDAVLVVVGEGPYAEYQGDRKYLGIDEPDLHAIRNARQANVPMVTIILSGRPLLIAPLLSPSDAIVAAWLPGSEGRGVTDVLFGDHRPTGRLPCSWPRSMAQIPINVGDAKYAPLFPYGFGLTY